MADSALQNSILTRAADKLVAAHDGDVALLWLYWLRHGDLDEEKAAGTLCRTLLEIRAAKEKLSRLGLPEGAEAPDPARKPVPPPAPAEELPQYTAAEITRLSRENDALQVIYDDAAIVFGHAPNDNELRVLVGIYDHLGLPPEVILELLHYCSDLNAWKYKGDRHLTPRFLEQEAYSWANREILTLEQAEEYIRRQRQRHTELGRLQEQLGLHSLSPTQEKDLRSWLDMGFGEEAISIAADRTMTNTGALKWGYLRKIILSWHEKGLHSPAEIREKDPARSQSRSAAAKEERSQKPLNPEAWENLMKKI